MKNKEIQRAIKEIQSLSIQELEIIEAKILVISIFVCIAELDLRILEEISSRILKKKQTHPLR